MTPSRDSTDPTPDPRIGPPAVIERKLCPDCGAEEGWWHIVGCPHRPKPYSRVTNAVTVRYLRDRVSEPEGERVEITDEMVRAALGPTVPLARAQELERERDEARADLERFYARRRTPTQMTEAARKAPYHVSGGLPFVDRQTFLGMIGQASEQVQRAEEAARDFAALLGTAHVLTEGPNARWHEDGPDSWYDDDLMHSPDCPICQALAAHPGFLPDTAQARNAA